MRIPFASLSWTRPALLAIALAVALPACGGEQTRLVPPPVSDEPLATAAGSETIVLSGGCFWGVQKVFQHVKGVQSAVSGYAGGSQVSADYETVSSGRTGHAESVQVRFDPSVVSLGTLLRIFFSVAHDPTQVGGQGPDFGPQYRSMVFTATDAQAQVAKSYIHQIDQARVFAQPITTRVEPLQGFYAAERYHQDYATLHPDSGYIAHYDLPKVRDLERVFPSWYRAQPQLVLAAAAGH
jgi:peptide-methionine (S)-S-oxide reductase